MSVNPIAPVQRRQELSWPDYQPEIVDALYPPGVSRLYAEELQARIGRVAAVQYVPDALPLEAAQLAAFMAESPEGSAKFRNGLGPLTRSLNRSVTEQLQGSPLARLLLDPQQGKWLVDPMLCNVACIGLQAAARESIISPGELSRRMRQAFGRAVTTTRTIFEDQMFRGTNANDTNWRSLFEQLVKASIFDTWQPTVITSVGGAEEQPTPAAAVNIIPGLRLTRLLREAGYNPTFTIGFASEFAIACNGADANRVRAGQIATEQLYRSFVARYYPDLAAAVRYERPGVEALQTDLPEQYVAFARQAMQPTSPDTSQLGRLTSSLTETALKRAANGSVDREKMLQYLLSHQLIFRDVQTKGQRPRPFVVKVGAPSELRFSRYQQAVTEGYMNAYGPGGGIMIPNQTQRDGGGAWRYGQITLYYPGVGSRPPYYRESEDEPTLTDIDSQVAAAGFERLMRSLDGSVERYAALEKVLTRAGIDPDDYMKFIAEFNYNRGSLS